MQTISHAGARLMFSSRKGGTAIAGAACANARQDAKACEKIKNG
jgi:hypothetical protein